MRVDTARMPLDLTAVSRDLRYLVRDRALQGTPLGDALLMFADSLDGIHYEFGAALRRLVLAEQRLTDLEATVNPQPAPDPNAPTPTTGTP